MATLDGFVPFDFAEGVPYFSVTQNGITFNKAVTLKLGTPEYVQLLINANSKQVALRACDESEKNATPYYRKKDNRILSVRWNGRDLINTLGEIMGCDFKLKGYRVEGVLLREENAMLFDLNQAKPLD